MSKLEYQFVYQQLTPSQKQAIIELWKVENAQPSELIQQRINQVSMIAMDNKQIVGVSSIYPTEFEKPDAVYFNTRIYLRPDYRKNRDFSISIIKANFAELQKRFGDKTMGIVVDLENKKLSRLGKTSFLARLGFTYYAKGPKGLQRWYVKFEQPKGIFA